MDKELVIQNLDTFHGEAPKAAIALTRKVTLAGSSATISTPELSDGQEVFYLAFKRAVVTSGGVTVTAAVPGATDVVDVVMLVPANALHKPLIP